MCFLTTTHFNKQVPFVIIVIINHAESNPNRTNDLGITIATTQKQEKRSTEEIVGLIRYQKSKISIKFIKDELSLL